MTELAADIRSALAEEGYDVREVTENRGTIRATLATADAPAGALRDLVAGVAGDRLLGVDVSAQHAGTDAVGTVLTVRLR